MANYAYQPAPNERLARARVDGVNASYKDLCNVCENVRGRRDDAALQFLSEAAEGERAVRYFEHNKHRGHVRSLGGKKGGWPVKSCKIVRDVLENAMANASRLGLGPCKIIHIQANKGVVYGRMASKGGKRGRSNLETAFVEIVLRELKTADGKEREIKKVETKPAEKKVEEKKIEAKKIEVQKTETAKVPQKMTV